MSQPNLGLDFVCSDDFDAQFRTSDDPLVLARQEIYHRLTTDSVLGEDDDGNPTPEAANFGRNVKRMLGRGMTDTDIAALGPDLTAVLQQSGRLSTADVTVDKLVLAPPLIGLQINATGKLATGDAFAFVFEITTADDGQRIGA